MPHRFNVVLVEPEIAPNTGSVGRTCLALGARLHLVEPMGFQIDNAKLRRAGLDYWKHIDLTIHKSYKDFLATIPEGAQRVFFSKKATRSHFQMPYRPGCYLIFGPETRGLPDDLIHEHIEECVKIPMYDERIRSLNLSNAVSIAVYEALRQVGE